MGPWYVPICCSNGNVTCCANVHCIPLCYYIEKSYCTDIHGLIGMYKDVFIYNPKNYSFLNLVENDNWVYDTSVYFSVHIFVPSE